MLGRPKIIAWSVAGVLHVSLVGLIASAAFERDLDTFDQVEIDLAIVLPVPPPAPDKEPEPELPTPVIPEDQTEPSRVFPMEDSQSEALPAEPAVETATPPPVRRITRRTVRRVPPTSPNAAAPYPETPPGPVQQTLRAFQCARLSPSQRRLCPTTDDDDILLSAMVAEARAAAPIYDPVYNVYRAQTFLDRFGRGGPQPGAFSTVENNSHITQTSTGDTATNGMVTQLNANPDPVFDGGRYEHWDSDFGRPPSD